MRVFLDSFVSLFHPVHVLQDLHENMTFNFWKVGSSMLYSELILGLQAEKKGS